MSIPEFPDSRKIQFEDKPLFDALFAARPPEISAYTFTNLFAWREPYQSCLSRMGEHVMVHHSKGGHRLCLEPLGPGDLKSVIEEAFRRSGGMEFERLHSPTAALFGDDPAYCLELDRSDCDYLYRADDLISLAGRKYDAKRNFINRFEPGDFEYVVMDGEVAMECHEFAQEWCEDRSCDTVEGLRRERCAVYEMLTNFDFLGIRGGAIRMGGRIVAFEIGELLNPDTLVIHVEKADSKIDGLYQLINNQFCAREARGLEYINREQDLGVPGLRKAKESYHPLRLVETWRLRSNS